MRSVKITVDVLLRDDIADWVENALGAMTFSSDLAYYLEQRHDGGYIITQDKLASIVDDVITDIDDYEDEDEVEEESEQEEEAINAKGIEAIMRRVLSEVITDKAVTLTGELHATEIKSSDNKDEDDSDDIMESDTLQTFGLSDNNEDCEDVSDQELDDLADMFGF